jgi:hypothetical protein
MVNVVKAAADVGVQDPWAGAVLAQCDRDGLNRIHCAAPWSASIGVRFKACLPFWFQSRFDDGLHHPVLSGRYAQRSLLAIVFGDIHPSDRFGLVPLQAQALLKQPPAGFGSVVHHSVHACRVFALVFLRHPPDGQELVGRGANQQFLKVFYPLPCFVRRGAIDTFLQASYISFHRVPVDVSPGGVGVLCSPFSENFHRLTSPKIRTWLEFSIVRTRRKSAPFRVGYVHVCGPIRLITGRHSLFPSSSTLCPVPLPYGRATTYVGSIGLTQLSMKKSAVRFGWSLYPGERLGWRHSQSPEVILLTSHVGHGLSASLAMSLSRGFKRTLYLRSTLPAFPSPPPHRGWQRSEHCPQSFAPRITRQHVWVGTPGHHGARSGFLSPSSILLHRPSEVSQEYACSLPGRKQLKAGARHERTLAAVACTRLFGAVPAELFGFDSAFVFYSTRTASTTLDRPAVGMMRSTR